MSGNNYRKNPLFEELRSPSSNSYYKLIVRESSLKAYWFNAGFVEGITSCGKKRKLRETGAFETDDFPTRKYARFAVYWFNKGRAYSSLWECKAFKKRLKNL